MNRRTLVFDLDGTIVSKNGILPEVAAAIRLASEKHSVCFASGRMHLSMAKLLKAADLEGPMISYNGALTSLDGRFISSRCLEPSDAAMILEFLRNLKVHRQLYVDDVLYVEEENEKIRSYSRQADVSFVLVKDLEKILNRGCIFKLLAYCSSKEEIEDVKAAALDSKMAGVDVFTSSNLYLEFVKKGVCKFEAVKELGKFMGFSADEVTAFGDGENDAELLGKAGIGIAMAPGHPKAIEAAKIVVDNTDGKGILRAFEEMGIA